MSHIEQSWKFNVVDFLHEVYFVLKIAHSNFDLRVMIRYFFFSKVETPKFESLAL